jgi:hypothetical protein
VTAAAESVPEVAPESAFSEEELAELALAADPDGPIDEDAVPVSIYLGRLPLVLPQWYMPPAIVSGTKRWRTALVIALVVAFVMIDAFGLCSTYGSVTLA